MSFLSLQQCKPSRAGLHDEMLHPTLSIDGFYVHVPFCFHKCHYCDFYSILDTSTAGSGVDRQAAFTKQLIAELDHLASRVKLHPRTIFVGGGTPTLLRIDLWKQLLANLRALGVLERVVEFSVEANPETVSSELMDLLANAGVNRVSIGAQSFQPELLKMLERWHDPAHVGEAVAMARAAGIQNVNLDLIFAIPEQSMAMLKMDLDTALALEPAHLSVYSLTYEPNTPMYRRLECGQFAPAPEQLEREMYAYVMDRLQSAGYEHYEISSWARSRIDSALTPTDKTIGCDPSPYRCQHNLNYWMNANWLAIGPSGASHVNGHRWKNEAHLGHYLDSGPESTITDYERLPKPRRVGEQLMLRLRMREGVGMDWLDENLCADDPRRENIVRLVDSGMLEQCENRLRLTRCGVFVADSVIAELL